MVLFHFPPVGGISMSRNVRNVQYLANHGWTPVVLTPAETDVTQTDPAASVLVPPGTRVIRTLFFEVRHLRPIVGLVRAAFGARRTARAHPSDLRPADAHADDTRPTDARPAAADPIPGRSDDADAGLTARLARLRRLVFFPDNQAGWFPMALTAALRAHRSTPFDLVYSTQSPATAHLVGAAFHGLTGVPWVAEFRDPWIGNVLEERRPWFQRQLQVKLERWMVRSADRIVCVTPSLTRMYQRRYPDAANIETIPNGYDRSEAVDRSPAEASAGRFRIVYTGTLDRPPELAVFLAGVDALVARRPDLAGKLEITFYGVVADACRAIADGFASHGHLAGILRFPGFVPRSVAIAAVRDADAALVLLGAGPGMGLFVPGKIYDYIGQNRQVLAMLPEGDARDLLKSLDWGVVAEPDAADVERTVERLLSLPAPDRPADPEGRYDRAVLAGRLAATLDAAFEAGRGGHETALER